MFQAWGGGRGTGTAGGEAPLRRTYCTMRGFAVPGTRDAATGSEGALLERDLLAAQVERHASRPCDERWSIVGIIIRWG